MKTAAEAQFLGQVLGSFVRRTPAPVAPDGLDWLHLERLAARNKSMSIVLHTLGAKRIPADIVQRWRHLGVGIELHYSRAHLATIKLCRWLEEAGIPAVVLRGMALASWAYPTPGLRPMVDVDILVCPGARDVLPAYLLKHGLTPAQKLRSQLVYQIDGVVFELHWSLLTPKRYRKLVNASAWLDSRVALPGGDGVVYRLTAEHELLELVCHSFIHHEVDSLLQLVDIALISQFEALDWKYVMALCERASVTRLFRFTLGFADALFNLGLQTRLAGTGVDLAPLRQRLAEAYEAPLFMRDARRHLLQRKINLLRVAEKPEVWLKQLIRFLNVDQLGRLIHFRP